MRLFTERGSEDALKAGDFLRLCGRIAYAAGRNEEAMELLRAGAEPGQATIETNYYLGLCHLAGGRMQACYDEFERLLVKVSWVAPMRYGSSCRGGAGLRSRFRHRPKLEHDVQVEQQAAPLDQRRIELILDRRRLGGRVVAHRCDFPVYSLQQVFDEFLELIRLRAAQFRQPVRLFFRRQERIADHFPSEPADAEILGVQETAEFLDCRQAFGELGGLGGGGCARILPVLLNSCSAIRRAIFFRNGSVGVLLLLLGDEEGGRSRAVLLGRGNDHHVADGAAERCAWRGGELHPLLPPGH